jgi:hypothetical protein
VEVSKNTDKLPRMLQECRAAIAEFRPRNGQLRKRRSPDTAPRGLASGTRRDAQAPGRLHRKGGGVRPSGAADHQGQGRPTSARRLLNSVRMWTRCGYPDAVAGLRERKKERTRRRGESPLDALRAHCHAATDERLPSWDRDALIPRIGVIFETPALSSAASGQLHRQRRSPACVPAEEHGETAAALMAAQIAASLPTLQESYCHRLADGASPQDVARTPAAHIELAIDLLERSQPIEGQ